MPASDAVTADDKPSYALRRRRQSSMWLACQSAADGRADSVVSAGNTGALLAISMFAMRMLEGAHRPALASFLPTSRGETVMLDLGANLECDAENLAEFSVMGSVFAQALLGLDAPKVGLLNVGSEELKGHEELRQAAAWLRREGVPVNFHGFVEGNDIGTGLVDVVVTDGFTGNVALKTAEGLARFFAAEIKATLTSGPLAMLGAVIASGALKKMRRRLDPGRVNGGPLLGLNGIVVKSHGGADAIGYASAIRVAVDLARSDFSAEIDRNLKRLTETGFTTSGAEEQKAGGVSGAEGQEILADLGKVPKEFKDYLVALTGRMTSN